VNVFRDEEVVRIVTTNFDPALHHGS